MKNLKGILSSICAWINAFCGGLLLLSFASEYPKWVMIVCGIAVLAANTTTQVLNGRNSDGSVKSEGQLSSKQPNI
jgi:hypothetical protein